MCMFVQVSFGVFETEEDAARQYDRALILEKGRSGERACGQPPVLHTHFTRNATPTATELKCTPPRPAPPRPPAAAKTNFPLREYEAEVVEFERYLTET
jgi:hypothetical protein